MRSRSLTIWVMVAIVFVSGQAMGWTQYNDGGTHDITTTINDDVWVDWEAPGIGTTVNVMSGASIPNPNKLQGFNDSSLNISSGSVYDLFVNDSSQVTMSGGTVDEHLNAYNTSQITMLDGSNAGWLNAFDSSQVTMSGGTVYCFSAYDTSQVTISGGSNDYLFANGGSHVTISGGLISGFLEASASQVTMSGGSISGHLYATGTSQVTMSGGIIGEDLRLASNTALIIDGFNFAIDGTPVGYGDITSLLGGAYSNEPSRILTGTLLNGDTINNQFFIGDAAQITLVPEPATLLLLGLGAVMLRKK